MTKPLHPTLRPNPTLPTFIDGNTPADQAARSNVLDTWTRQWGTPDDLALLASCRGEARYLNLLAHSRLRAAGRLAARPSLTASRARERPSRSSTPTQPSPPHGSVPPTAAPTWPLLCHPHPRRNL